MTFDKFTIKAQEAIQEAVNTAQMAHQQAIEPVHLLQGIMQKGRDVTNFVFQKLGVNAMQIENLVQQEAQTPAARGRRSALLLQRLQYRIGESCGRFSEDG